MAITDLPVPSTGAVTSLPVPETGAQPVDDASTFRATAGQFRRGFRQGMNNVGGMLSNLIGQSAESLGLTDFANSRFEDAKHFTDFADAVGPDVRDIGQAKDFDSLINFATGQAGSGLATSIPVVAAAVGLRRPVAGVFGGTAALETGEQVGNLRDNPNIKKSDIFPNALAKGTINAGIELLGGAELRAAKALSKPARQTVKGALGQVAKGTVGEAATEGAQEYVGQKLEQQLDPTKQIDPHQILNAAAAGAAGGGALTAISTGASHAAGALASTPEELRKRLSRRQPPLDPNGEPDGITADTPMEEAISKVQAHDDKVAQTYGENPEEGFKKADAQYTDEVRKPLVQRAIDAGKEMLKKVDQKHVADSETKYSLMGNRDQIYKDLGEKVLTGKKVYAPPSNKEVADFLAQNGYKQESHGVWIPATQKHSEQRGQIDSEIHAYMMENLNPDTIKGASPENLLQLSRVIRNVAAQPGVLEDSPMVRAFSRAVGDEKFQDIMNFAMEKVHGKGPALDVVKDISDKAFKGRKDTDEFRLRQVQDILRTYATDHYRASPSQEKVLLNDFAPQLVDWIGNKTGGSKMDAELLDKVKHVFGEKWETALDLLEGAARPRQGHSTVADMADAAQGKEDSPYVDPRLGQELTMDKAQKTLDDLRHEYGNKEIRFSARPVEGKPGMFTLDANEKDLSELDEAAWERVRETKGYSGLQNGVLTVKSYTRNKFGKLSEVENKINLVALTHEMMRQEKQQPQQGGAKYVADMFSRGITSLLTAKINKAGPGEEPEMVNRFRDFKEADLHKIPNRTVIATLHGKTYTWGDLRKLNFGTSEEATRARREMATAKTPEERAKARKSLLAHYDEERDRSEAATPSGPRYDDEVSKTALNEDVVHRKFVDGKKVSGNLQREQGGGSVQDERQEETMRGQTKGGPRTIEEDTRTPVGEGGAPSFANREPVTKNLPKSKEQAMAEEQAAKKAQQDAAADERIRKRVAEEYGGGTEPVAKGADTVSVMKQAIDEVGEKSFKRRVQARIRKAEKAGLTKDDGHYTEEVAREIVFGKSGKTKLSAMNIGTEEESVTPEQEKEVREYVERVLGPKAKVFIEKMESTGSFAKLSGVETLKVSIDALDPKAAAYHEAVHALMLRLLRADPKARAVLMRAARAPHIVNKLRELLAGHPEALEQLSDAEERVAYMYQFWASGQKGLLNIGSETKGWFNKVRNFFKKVRALWADDLNNELALERAGELLDAFHSGELANPNTVQQVLQKKFPLAARERMDKFFPALGTFLDKFIFTAAGAVRDMNFPMLTEIMDKFHIPTESTGRQPGFIQTWRNEYNRRLSQVMDILKPMDANQRDDLLTEMRSNNHVSPAAKKLEAILSESFTYITRAGVKVPTINEDGKVVYRDIKKVEKYFPRVPDLGYLRTEEGKTGFIALLAKHGIQDPKSVYETYAKGPESSDPRTDAAIGLTFFAPQTQERQLAMIPDSELAPFLSKDLFGTMSQYLARAARRAEYTRRFGNSGEEIRKALLDAQENGMTPDQEKTFSEAVQAMEGSLGSNMSDELKSMMGAITTYQNLRLLPLALFSSLIDPMGIMVRGGTLKEAGQAFTRGVRNLFSEKQDDKYDFAKSVGAISTAHDAAVMQDMYSSQFMPKTQQIINDAFFKYNGMESWNRSMRTMAAASAEQFIIRHATSPNEHSARYLRELNLKESDIQVQDGKLKLNDKTRQAINLWIDQAILRPNAAVRPIYMSDPHWVLISHLKQYMYLFQKTIIARVQHEMQHGNYTPAAALSLYVPGIIASDMLRSMITPGSGDDRKDWSTSDYMWSGVQRAGLFGPGQVALDANQDMSFDKIGIESAMGPTAQQFLDFLRAGSQGHGMGNEFVKAIPGTRFFR